MNEVFVDELRHLLFKHNLSFGRHCHVLALQVWDKLKVALVYDAAHLLQWHSFFLPLL